MARTADFKRLMTLLSLATDDVSLDRRRFLKTAAMGSMAAVAVTGCGSFDRWVLGDNHKLNEEVLVLGGGLAGLAAAYHLKRSKIPYRLFEGSSRLGGRVQTLRHFNSDGQFAEMGAEFFDGGHQAVHQLCRDLNLNAQNISYDSKMDRAVYWVHGKMMEEKHFKRLLRPMALKLAQARQEVFAAIATEITPKSLVNSSRAKAVDSQSLADFLAVVKSTVPEGILQCFETLCVSEWGVEASEINLLQFLVRLDFEERSMAGGGNRLYRIEGGASRMTDILGERVQGVVPNATLKLEHQLVALRESANGFECTFKTAQGSDVLWARQIICTLPWSILKEVDGIQSLDLGSAAKGLIEKATYATHSKVVSSFKSAIWKNKGLGLPPFQGIFRGDLLGQVYWEGSRGQSGNKKILISQRGGGRGQSTGAAAPNETLKDLRNFSKDWPAEEASQVTNWSQKKFSKGSRYNVPPGSYLTYLEYLSRENEGLTFYMAGEHTSFRDFGTMNGAIESAMVAAEKAIQKAFIKSFL